MPFRNMTLGALVGLLFLSGPAWPQETVLNGILSNILPGARVSWSTGVSRAGSEIYEDLFVGQGNLRLRFDRVTVTPDGFFARVEAEGLVANLDTDATFALEIGSLKASISAAAISAFRSIDGVPDFCRIGAAGADVEIRELRALRTVGREGRRLIRSEIRADLVDVRQDIAAAGSGCELRIAINLVGAQEARSDKSGTRLDTLDFTLSLPGNIATLALDGAPPIRLSATFAGFLRQIPGGASVALAQEGGVQLELSALSAVPALTSHLKTRGEPATDRGRAIVSALIPGELRASGALEGVTLLAEALVPADRISGLSRASLTSVIGNYQASVETVSGKASGRIVSEIVGVGRTVFEVNARMSKPDPGAPSLGIAPSVEPFLPRFHLDVATLRHLDRGLLRAIELITGSSVGVLAAIYIENDLKELSEPWHAPARRAVSEIARFLSASATGDGAEIELRTPTDLSILETYRLLSLRPDLVDRLVSSEVRRADPG